MFCKIIYVQTREHRGLTYESKTTPGHLGLLFLLAGPPDEESEELCPNFLIV